MSKIELFSVTTEQLQKAIIDSLKNELQEFKLNFNTQKQSDDLLTRKEACEFLKIDSSTLWHWTNKGKVKAYGIGNRRYYKRAELLECLIPLKKQGHEE